MGVGAVSAGWVTGGVEWVGSGSGSWGGGGGLRWRGVGEVEA